MDFLDSIDIYVTHNGDTWDSIIENHYGVTPRVIVNSLTDNELIDFKDKLLVFNGIYEGVRVFPAGIKIKMPNIDEIKVR